MTGTAAKGTGESTVLAEVGGRKITQCDVIARLKLDGTWQQTLDQLTREAHLARVAQTEKVQVADSELQTAFDDYRLAIGLEKAIDTQRWLQDSGTSIEHVESMVESDILYDKLAEKLVPAKEIEAWYNQNPQLFDYARISTLAVKTKGEAEELALSVKEESEDFHELARKHSIDEETRAGGGYVGEITRDEAAGLSADAADRIFAATETEVVGPFELPGGTYCLVRVLEVGRSPLDESTRDQIRHQLFEEKMAELATEA